MYEVTHTHAHARVTLQPSSHWLFGIRAARDSGTVTWGGGPDWRAPGIIRGGLKLPKEQQILRPQPVGRAAASGVGPVRHASDQTSTRLRLRLCAQDTSAAGTSGGFLQSSVEYFGPVPLCLVPADMEYTSSPKPQLSSRANAFSIAALMSSGKSSKDKDTEESTIKPLGKIRPAGTPPQKRPGGSFSRNFTRNKLKKVKNKHHHH